MEKECIILGDFNTNLLPPSKSCLVKSFSKICKVFGLQQLITEHTGVSVNCQSVLDLILASECEMGAGTNQASLILP